MTSPQNSLTSTTQKKMAKKICAKYRQHKINYELSIKDLPRGSVRASLLKFLANALQELGICTPGATLIEFCQKPRRFSGRLTTYVACATMEDANHVLSLDGISFQGSTLSIFRKNYDMFGLLDSRKKFDKSETKHSHFIICPNQKKHSGEVIIYTQDTVTSDSNKKVKKKEPIEFNDGVRDCINLKKSSSDKLSILHLELDSAKALIEIQKAEICRLSYHQATLDKTICSDIEIDYLLKEYKTIDQNNNVIFGTSKMSNTERELAKMKSEMLMLHCDHLRMMKLKDEKIYHLEIESARTREVELSKSLSQSKDSIIFYEEGHQ
eukprot:CAMPEP_0194362024 /NCGR_PEP_ID=MMETSP0174-20130528/9678_1 /TAXON_ID=216777 /ORGANISM="Proboscia alata, Strain PI-D3" /LENGTH=323 /DNA_ID=CAMNT_0039134591 /DNA_START=171 /DNA_END=1142 /DNA_ORIENTATION=+